MKIATDTRSGTCRHCGATVEWVRRAGSSGPPIAFDPPLVFTPVLLPDADWFELDRVVTKLHAATCSAFVPKLLRQGAR